MDEDAARMAVNNTPAEYSREDTARMTRDYIGHRLRAARDYKWPPRPQSDEDVDQPLPPTVACDVLRGLGDEFEKRYRDVFDEMCTQLEVTVESAYPAFLSVSNELFSEGVQWGRIVALFAFGGSLAVRVLDDGMPQLIDSIAEWVSTYVDEKLSTWIVDNGSWDAFIDYYDSDVNQERRKQSPWPTLRNFFCGVAAGAIGVLTIGAFLTSRS